MTEKYESLRDANLGNFRNGKLMPAETEEKGQFYTTPTPTISIIGLTDLTPEQITMLSKLNSGSYRH